MDRQLSLGQWQWMRRGWRQPQEIPRGRYERTNLLELSFSSCVRANARCAVFRHSGPPPRVDCLALTACLPH